MKTPNNRKEQGNMKNGVTVRQISEMKAQVSAVELDKSVHAHTSIAAMRRHRDFTSAKAGNTIAALNLVRDLSRQERITRLGEQHPGAMVVPVLGTERTGINMLPLAFAKFIGSLAGLQVETGIVQINKTHHTDSDAMHRLLNRPEFSGTVIAGQDYIVIDDVITSGSTVQALRLFIESHGGKVVAFSALAGSFSIITGSSLEIDLTKETINALDTKFGLNAFASFICQAGIAQTPEELTNSQARYLLSFGTLNSIRTRIAPQHHQFSFQTTRSTPQTQMTLAFA